MLKDRPELEDKEAKEEVTVIKVEDKDSTEDKAVKSPIHASHKGKVISEEEGIPVIDADGKVTRYKPDDEQVKEAAEKIAEKNRVYSPFGNV